LWAARIRLAVECCNVAVDELQATGLCLTPEPQAVTELKAIDRKEQRIFAAVQPGGEIRYQPGFGNRKSICRVEEPGHDSGQGRPLKREILYGVPREDLRNGRLRLERIA
jgi:hypothetical protein